MLAKILCFSLLLFLPVPVFACGIYEINGVVRRGEHHYLIVMAEKTKSQMVLETRSSGELSILPYENFPIHAIVSIEQKFDGTLGKIAKVIEIRKRVPDPIHPTADTYLKLKKAEKCEKERE